MVPVENSLAGRVADIHHLIPESGLFIVGEHFQRVNHQLLGLKNSNLEDLKYVKSHAQGLAQCRNIIKKHKLLPIQHIDTAGAAEEISRLGDPSVAAIASSMSAKIYDLKVLKSNIEDAEHNTTRFLIMAQNPQVPSINISIPVTTIIFEVRSVPAALYKVLGGFATNGINLTKLESYIGGKEMNAARFYVDAEGHPDTKAMQNALEEMYFYSEPSSVKIIGTYSRTRKN
jgi:prephenate dehydratase